jgi:hypothetical protein
LAIVEPAKPKATITGTSSGCEIVVPPKRNWFITVFLGVWLCGWAMGEITVSRSLFFTDFDRGALLFTAVWLVFWTIGGAFVAYIFLWSLVGRERVVLSPARLSIKRELLGFGRFREYELAQVSDLRVSPSTYNPFDFRSGLQFRHNTAALRGNSHEVGAERLTTSLQSLIANPGMAQLVAKASRNYGELTYDERLQVGSYWTAIFAGAEVSLPQWQLGNLDEAVWQRDFSVLRPWLHSPGVQEWYARSSIEFTPEFRALVEREAQTGPPAARQAAAPDTAIVHSNRAWSGVRRRAPRLRHPRNRAGS